MAPAQTWERCPEQVSAAGFLGVVGGAIGRTLPALLAALVVFVFLAGTPLFATGIMTYERSRAELERRYDRR